MKKKIKEFFRKIIKFLKSIFKKEKVIPPIVDPPTPPPIDLTEYILTENGEKLSTENGDNLII